MKKLIINGDDFGFSRGVNHGIIDAYQEGILTSTTVLTNMPGANHAYKEAASHPGLGVGIHLNLTLGKPMLSSHHTIVDENGLFRKLPFYKGSYKIDAEEIYVEWKAQIESAITHDLTPTHLDSHHHIHSYPGMPEVFVSLAKEYRLPVRRVFSQKEDSLFSDLLTAEQFIDDVDILKKTSAELRNDFGQAETIEIMTHPAYLDKTLMSHSSYRYPRVDELSLLMNADIKNKLNDYQLIHYGHLKT
ncbi:chitin disaccharide deacetylase [Alteribacillus sp. JSM 102045]|uniref:chitin disaccharide deacetylase n=1 Tax=Alteribacillus sp. JSM 102045 TaxID=1562101 RepID=UPI0035BF8058